jgi:predicted alpha-1,2-mannosidase
LEYANDDFALAQFALALGDDNKHQFYLRRSGNWRNVFNPSSHWIQARNSDGSWASEFTLTTKIIEGDSYQYTWMVPYNLRGLFEAMGGNAVAVQRLDNHLTKLNEAETSIYANMGNEPEEEVPWEYDFAGAPWRTQDVVRRIALHCFRSTPRGLPGNDDGGAMSSWLVWGMMGIFPQIPGVGGFVIGSPLFTSVTVRPESGHDLQIIAPTAADTNQYVQNLLLNGHPSTKLWVPVSTVLGATNTTLAFTLGNTPNMAWGSSDIDAPPSYNDGMSVSNQPASSPAEPASPPKMVEGDKTDKYAVE